MYTIIPKHCTTVFSPSANCVKVIFLQAVIEVRLSLYKAFSKLRYNTKNHPDTDKAYVSKKDSTILGWSAQSKPCLVFDTTCNDRIFQTWNILDQYPDVF